MTIEEIEAALIEALPLRVPRRDPDESGRAWVERLETYMLGSAFVNGRLIEARHWLREARDKLLEDWEKLDGWQIATTKPRAKLSAADIERAKIQVAPAHYDAIRKAKRLSESIDDQIVRLEREEKTCSRAYTMTAGG